MQFSAKVNYSPTTQIPHSSLKPKIIDENKISARNKGLIDLKIKIHENVEGLIRIIKRNIKILIHLNY